MPHHAAHPPVEPASRCAVRRTGSPSYEEFNGGERTVAPSSGHGTWKVPPRGGSLRLPLPAFPLFEVLLVCRTTDFPVRRGLLLYDGLELHRTRHSTVDNALWHPRGGTGPGRPCHVPGASGSRCLPFRFLKFYSSAERRTGTPSYEAFNGGQCTLAPERGYGAWKAPPRGGSLWLPLPAFPLFEVLLVCRTTDFLVRRG